MKWLQVFRNFFPKHKYAINAKLLGEDAEFPWSNLGYWQADTNTYPHACQALADHLAQAIDLNATDNVLDLGCGQGASLLHWQTQYQVQHLSAVDIQPVCIAQLEKKLNASIDLRCGSFLNLNVIFPETRFSAVLCIDAAYHSNLNSFLRSTHSVLNSNGRIGFHYLMLSEQYLNLNTWQKLKYQSLLKAADVNVQHLLLQADLYQCIENFKFKDIQIQDISLQVFAGFENYVATVLNATMQSQGIDELKIQMTAKLCRILYEAGIVKYVQITAQKA